MAFKISRTNWWDRYMWAYQQHVQSSEKIQKHIAANGQILTLLHTNIYTKMSAASQNLNPKFAITMEEKWKQIEWYFEAWPEMQR